MLSILKNEKISLITVFSGTFIAFLVGSILAIFFRYQIITGLSLGLTAGVILFLLTIINGYSIAYFSQKNATKAFSKKVFGGLNFIFTILKLLIAAIIFVTAGLLFSYFNAIDPIALLIGAGIPTLSFLVLQFILLIKDVKADKKDKAEVTW